MDDKKLINISAEEISRLLNKDAIALIDRLRSDVGRLLGEINISYMHAYKPLIKILDDCDAYDRKIEAMGIYINK